MNKNLNNTNWGKQMLSLGYNLHGWSVDPQGKKRRFSTSPVSGSGAVNYFDNLKELRQYWREVLFMREMQELDHNKFQQKLWTRKHLNLYPFDGSLTNPFNK